MASNISKKTSIGCLKYALASIVLIVIFVLLLSITSAIQKQHRQELFCETLKSGMSMPEVLAIVDQHGNFVKGQYAHNDFTTVLLGPSDIKTRRKFGIRGIVLNLTSNWSRIKELPFTTRAMLPDR